MKGDWVDNLPEVLTWREKPDLVVGDIVVFEEYRATVSAADVKWATRKGGEDGIRVPTELSRKVPIGYITITHIGRHKKGHWYARFSVTANEKPDYLAYTAGHTADPKRALDIEAPAAPVEIDPEQQERDEVIRAMKRREASPTKREQLVLEREAHKRRLKRTNSEISRRVLPGLIERLDAQIEAIDESTSRRAA